MKKLLIGCMAAIAALIALSGCDQDKVLYNGSSYLMFSDTLYTYAVQETNEIFNVPISATVAAAHDLFRSHALQQLRSLKIELALLYDVNVPLVVRYEGHAAIVIYDPSRIAPFKRDKRLRPFSFRKLFSPGQLYIRQPACQRSDKYK